MQQIVLNNWNNHLCYVRVSLNDIFFHFFYHMYNLKIFDFVEFLVSNVELKKL